MSKIKPQETIPASAAFTSGSLRLAFDAGVASARGLGRVTVQQWIDLSREEYDRELTTLRNRLAEAEAKLKAQQTAADFGQSIFDMVECLHESHYDKDAPRNEQLDGFISAWQKLKREKEVAESALAKVRELAAEWKRTTGLAEQFGSGINARRQCGYAIDAALGDGDEQTGGK